MVLAAQDLVKLYFLSLVNVFFSLQPPAPTSTLKKKKKKKNSNSNNYKKM